MYICLKCWQVFTNPKSYIEKHGLDSPPYENIDACPFCSGEYEEAEQCRVCGGWYAMSEKAVFNGQCWDCFHKEFTFELGLQFLAAKQLEETFFLSIAFKVPKVSNIRSKQLADIYKEEFIQDIEDEKYPGLSYSYQETLRHFCMNDADEWVGFMNSRNSIQLAEPDTVKISA